MALRTRRNATRNMQGMLKMPAKGHYLAEWRKRSGLSLQRLAQRLERSPGEEMISYASLHRIEKGEQPMSLEILNGLALAFECEPADILTVNPLTEGKVIDLLCVLRALPDEKIEVATRLLRAIA